MVFSMDPNKTIVRKQIDAIQFGSVIFFCAVYAVMPALSNISILRFRYFCSLYDS